MLLLQQTAAMHLHSISLSLSGLLYSAQHTTHIELTWLRGIILKLTSTTLSVEFSHVFRRKSQMCVQCGQEKPLMKQLSIQYMYKATGLMFQSHMDISKSTAITHVRSPLYGVIMDIGLYRFVAKWPFWWATTMARCKWNIKEPGCGFSCNKNSINIMII